MSNSLSWFLSSEYSLSIFVGTSFRQTWELVGVLIFKITNMMTISIRVNLYFVESKMRFLIITFLSYLSPGLGQM